MAAEKRSWNRYLVWLDFSENYEVIQRDGRERGVVKTGGGVVFVTVSL